jgi:tRNA-Thr(GGU) m(6)t(6)A37 methyltransferase TsaA
VEEDEVTERDTTYEIHPIGVVESPITDLAAAPPQGDEGAPDTSIVLRPELGVAVRDLESGMRVIVLTWLHHADRTVRELHPRGDRDRPTQGVFSTRSPDRPNPIGLHEVEILAIDGTRLRVRNLEAVDGTPVVDIKPMLGPVTGR